MHDNIAILTNKWLYILLADNLFTSIYLICRETLKLNRLLDLLMVFFGGWGCKGRGGGVKETCNKYLSKKKDGILWSRTHNITGQIKHFSNNYIVTATTAQWTLFYYKRQNDYSLFECFLWHLFIFREHNSAYFVAKTS